MDTPWRYIALLVLIAMARDTVAVGLTFCSGSNTADGPSKYSMYQTNGLCSDGCGGFAFAITQGSNCWCSNYMPGDTVSTNVCDLKCPGYPTELCGGTGGQFGYIALNKQPIGTVGGNSPASPTQAAPTSQAPPTTQRPATVTVTPPSSSSTSSSTSTSTEKTTQMPSAVTSIITLPGQTQVSTIIISSSASPTADSSPLGQGASIDPAPKGLSKGAVAGLAIGVALGVSAIAGVLIFFLLRRMKQQRQESEAAITPEMVGAVGGTPSSMSRHTSTMSQNGLLNKNPRINTRNLSQNWSSQGASAASTSSPTGTGNRRSLGADQRLDPYHAIYTNEDLRHSDVSLQDNTDYSRKILSVRNRADGEVEDE